MNNSNKRFSLDFEKPLRSLEEQIESLRSTASDQNVDLSAQIQDMQQTLEKTKVDIFRNLTPWQKIQLARHPLRPYSQDYVADIFTNFQELHGDRLYKDDRAIIGGTAEFDGQHIMVILQQKGRNTKENLERNFGSPNPEGYRKAARLMKLAQKFNLPIITFVDTPGAYPGLESEERHVAEAIAYNIELMSRLSVPIITTIVGEGGSGGALGIAMADKVLIMENAYYSVISPEGCAAILWKDRAYAPQAAEALKITANQLLKLKIVDEVIPEPLGGAHNEPEVAFENVRKGLKKHLKELLKHSKIKLLDNRYQKYREMGQFEELELEAMEKLPNASPNGQIPS